MDKNVREDEQASYRGHSSPDPIKLPAKIKGLTCSPDKPAAGSEEHPWASKNSRQPSLSQTLFKELAGWPPPESFLVRGSQVAGGQTNLHEISKSFVAPDGGFVVS